MSTQYFEPNLTWSQRELDLHDALEHQIDIVLRLENERLALLKETRTLKEQVKELADSGAHGNNMSFALSVDTLPDHTKEKKESQEIMTQTEEPLVIPEKEIKNEVKPEVMTQTEELVLQKPIEVHQEKKESQEVMTQTDEPVLEQQLVEPAKEIKAQLEPVQTEKKVDDKMKRKPATDKMPVKSLKFVKGKENVQKPANVLKDDTDKSFLLNSSKLKMDKSNTSILELESLKEEIAALKMENRFYTESYKSVEKERNELRQEMFNKDESYEALQQEVEQLRITLESNDYRIVKKLESELRKTKESNKEQTEELIILRNEKYRLEEELKNFKVNLVKLREEYEKESKDDTKLYAIMKAAKMNEARVKDLETELLQKNQELSILKEGKEGFIQEKEKLEEDVEYFKQMARNSKAHAEKAIADVDTYRNMLAEISKNQRR